MDHKKTKIVKCDIFKEFLTTVDNGLGTYRVANGYFL